MVVGHFEVEVDLFCVEVDGCCSNLYFVWRAVGVTKSGFPHGFITELFEDFVSIFFFWVVDVVCEFSFVWGGFDEYFEGVEVVGVVFECEVNVCGNDVCHVCCYIVVLGN